MCPSFIFALFLLGMLVFPLAVMSVAKANLGLWKRRTMHTDAQTLWVLLRWKREQLYSAVGVFAEHSRLLRASSLHWSFRNHEGLELTTERTHPKRHT